MSTEEKCCHGKYHVEIDGKFYCMAPPNYKCGKSVKDVGKFTEGEKKILYCKNHQYPCTKYKDKKDWQNRLSILKQLVMLIV